MCRSIILRLLSMVLITGAAVLPGIALGQNPISQFHDHFTHTRHAELCGIPVVLDSVVTQTFFVYADGSIRVISTLRAALTNPSNGQSVIVSSAGPATVQTITDDGAGTVTAILSYKGLPEKIQTAYGPVLLRDAGFFTIVNIFDLVTGELISHEITVNHGPHPEGDSDGTLFCEMITAALT